MKNYNFNSKVKYLIFSIILLSCGNGNMNSMNSKEENISDDIVRIVSTSEEDYDGEGYMDFKDNTQKYKGKVIEQELTYWETTPLKKVNQIINQQNSKTEVLEIQFFLSHYGGKFKYFDYKIKMNLPRGIEVPNVNIHEKIIVRFKCNDGDLDKGNEIISITRPTS